ncbi:glycosyltransferase family 4 protein [Ornithinimicrobium sufpigmenti]|uniref:glycosyltransferase family 4 protein n=1 Tax=Ornithinimicrobium sufpigmenti TaxID=2508882 RepID=UPI001036B661|nr:MULTISPECIES: glycosyltransferase family 4 protein [unclassified Ornithinimicrobium]
MTVADPAPAGPVRSSSSSSSSSSNTSPGGADGPVLSGERQQRIVVVAGAAEDLEPVVKHLRGLALAGHQIVLLWWHGEPGPRLDRFKARVQVDPSVSGARDRLRRVVTTARQRQRPGRPPLATAVQQDRRALRTLEGADALILAGPAAQAAAGDLVPATLPVVTAEELAGWEAVSGVWRRLESEVTAGAGEITARYVRSLLRHAELLGRRVPPTSQPLLVPVVAAMHRAGAYDLARGVAELLDPDEAGLDPVGRAERRGWRALTELSATATPPYSMGEVVAEVVRAADLTLDRDEVGRTVDLATLALSLLFHRELHADGLSSPLVDDPDGFLADWRGSRVGTLLASSSPRRAPRPARSSPAGPDTPPDAPPDTGPDEGPDEGADEGAGEGADTGRRPRVVVVPGTYPQFSVPVIAALGERAEVRRVELAARSDLRGLGPWRGPVDARLRQALGVRSVPDYEVLEEMEAASAVFVDWADRGALATVMAVPEGVPLTLRVHSMDALSPWIHLIDWSRVDHLVLVSEPIRQLVLRLLGDRLASTRVHVVPNVLDPSRLPTGKTDGHLRRLLLVGWGQQVKDPLWALDVLGALREQDPTWRLSLLGTDFPTDAVRSQQQYARRFRARLTQDDVRGAVDIEGYTRDVAPYLAASGFVLSTSRRESFGLGMVEAAASGAVPVVRDWPIFASLDAARSLFPHHWVVGTVQEAADRIRALGQEPEWSQASAEARQVVEERFSSGDARATFQELVLGPR